MAAIQDAGFECSRLGGAGDEAALLLEVRQAALSITDASAQIASGNLDLSTRTERAAASLQQAAASLDALTGTVRKLAESAQTASRIASVHQFGLRDRVNKHGTEADYPQRQLLGITKDEENKIETTIVEFLANHLLI